MLVGEASVVEQLLRDLFAEHDLSPVIEFDALTAHEPAPAPTPLIGRSGRSLPIRR